MTIDDNKKIAEQLRLVISIAIIASIIAILSMDDARHGLAVSLAGFAVIPGILLSLYILFSAAHLKYKNSGDVGQMPIPEKLRRWCYDHGVNSFWTMFLLATLIIVAILSGWDGNSGRFLDFWPSFVVSFVFLGVLMVWSNIIVHRKKGFSSKDKVRSRKVSKKKNE